MGSTGTPNRQHSLRLNPLPTRVWFMERGDAVNCSWKSLYVPLWASMDDCLALWKASRAICMTSPNMKLNTWLATHTKELVLGIRPKARAMLPKAVKLLHNNPLTNTCLFHLAVLQKLEVRGLWHFLLWHIANSRFTDLTNKKDPNHPIVHVPP